MRNIEKNFERLSSNTYSIDNIFQPSDYGWPGDWEGRALLAFVCHYKISGKKIPCMQQMMERLKDKTNAKYYFGNEFDGMTVDEQQISGHNWYLRGLLEYAKAFESELALSIAKSVVENLYLPILKWYAVYPIERSNVGEVSGHVNQEKNGWRLSSDVGCAFMCVDGLAQYFALTNDYRVKELLDGIIDLYASLDKVKIGFQTHTTLTAGRGIFKLYESTGEEKYLKIVEDVFKEYVNYGMTLTYQNYNWYGRENSWTEPCAVVDSFILSTELFKATSNEEYKRLARRIWFNGLQFCQRGNGGAGTDKCVTLDNPILQMDMYEAPFCCTMRYSEGLLEYVKNKDLFEWDSSAKEEIDDAGRRFIDDKLIVLLNGEKTPIFSCVDFTKEQIEGLKLKVIF